MCRGEVVWAASQKTKISSKEHSVGHRPSLPFSRHQLVCDMHDDMQRDACLGSVRGGEGRL